MAREAGPRRAGEPRGVRGAQAVRRMDLRAKLLDPAQHGPALRHDAAARRHAAGAGRRRPRTSSPRASPACRSTAWWSTTSRTRPAAPQSPRPFPFVGTIDPRDYAEASSRPARRSSTRRSARWTRRSGAPGSPTSRDARRSSCPIVGRPDLRRALSAAAFARDPHRGRDRSRLHRRRRGDRRAPRRAAQRGGAPARQGHRGLRLLHLAGGLPRAADAAPARRLPARLPRRRRRSPSASCSPSRPAGARRRSPSCAGWASTSRRRPSARSSARRSPLARIDPRSAATTCAASSTARYAGEIPLGVNVESVSINRDEIDASVELFHALREVLAGR